MSLGKKPCSIRPGWLQGVGGGVIVVIAVGDCIAVGNCIAVGDCVAVDDIIVGSEAERVMFGVGGRIMSVGGTAVTIRVGIGLTAVVTGSTVQPIKTLIMRNKNIKGRIA